MKWDRFLSDVKAEMVIESQYLYILYRDKKEVDLQLSRWKKEGKIHRLKKGFYILDEEYRRTEVFEPYIAAVLKTPSYISLEKALEMHHLIPDAVYTFTSVTTKRRPVEFVNRVGRFKYVTVKQDYFWGYRAITQGSGTGYHAEPEKALIDLFYCNQKKVDGFYIDSLRLQNTEIVDQKKLAAYASRLNVPFVKKAVELLIKKLERN